MSLTGSGPGRPAAGRRPDRRPARRDVRRLRRGRGAARARAHRPGPASSAPPCSRPWSACTPSRAPAWTVGREVAAGRRATTTPRSRPYGLFRCRDGAVQIARRQRGLWRRLCEAFGLDPATPGFATNAERVARPRARHRGGRGRVRRLGRRGAAGALGRGGHPRRQGAHARRGLRLGPDAQPGPPRRRGAPPLGRVTLPGPPLRFFDSTGAETSSREHMAPPCP